MSVAPVAPTRTASDSTIDLRGAAARKALRRLASGVVVLTVVDANGPHGTTVSAVVPVSREPVILAACLRTSSTFLAMARETGWLSVNVLTHDQHPAAARFAEPGRRPGHAQFAGLAYHPDPRTGAPLLDGALAHLSCQVTYCLPVGDHDVMFARVVDGVAGTGSPLLNFAGRLHGIPVPEERS